MSTKFVLLIFAVVFGAVLASAENAPEVRIRIDKKNRHKASAPPVQHVVSESPTAPSDGTRLAKVFLELNPAPTQAQMQLAQDLAAEHFNEALQLWRNPADGIATAKFSASPSGKIFFSLLMHKAGLKLFALRSLLASAPPEKLLPALRAEIAQTIPATDSEWGLLADEPWAPAWGKFLGPEFAVQVQAHRGFHHGQEKELDALISETPAQSNAHAWFEWQRLLAQSTAANLQPAVYLNELTKIDSLVQGGQLNVSRDLINLTKARLLYAAAETKSSILMDDKIPKSSDDWFDAQEESAWAELRQNNPQNALAITQTLILPGLVKLVGPETVYLRALSALKACVYPEVAKMLDLYRSEFKRRTKSRMEFADHPDPAVVELVIEHVGANFKMTDLGERIATAPRLTSRDRIVSIAGKSVGQLESEAKLLKKAGLDVDGELRNAIAAAADSKKEVLKHRLQQLAKDELTEMSQVLQKMRIIDVELVQAVALKQRLGQKGLASALKKGTTGSPDLDRISFPDEGEIWFDEVANYQVDLQTTCPSSRRQ